MSQSFDFTRFVPGFDFLKGLTPAAGASSTASKWVAPTLDPQELEKRITELKTVHFWLDQNTKAVGATIQALEVQRMTLATLKEMNVSFSEMAEAFKIKPVVTEPESSTGSAQFQTEQKSQASDAQSESASAASNTTAVDPTQWWGALTQQFQQIANKTMTDLAKNAAVHEQMNAQAAQASAKKASTSSTTKSSSAKKPAAKKSASQPKPPAAKKTSTRAAKTTTRGYF